MDSLKRSFSMFFINIEIKSIWQSVNILLTFCSTVLQMVSLLWDFTLKYLNKAFTHIVTSDIFDANKQQTAQKALNENQLNRQQAKDTKDKVKSTHEKGSSQSSHTKNTSIVSKLYSAVIPIRKNCFVIKTIYRHTLVKH